MQYTSKQHAKKQKKNRQKTPKPNKLPENYVWNQQCLHSSDQISLEAWTSDQGTNEIGQLQKSCFLVILLVITYHQWETVYYSVRQLFSNIFLYGSIYGNFFTHSPSLFRELMASMVSGAAIPSNEINYSFNFERFFICRNHRCSLDRRNKKNFSCDICK